MSLVKDILFKDIANTLVQMYLNGHHVEEIGYFIIKSPCYSPSSHVGLLRRMHMLAEI